MPDFLSNKTPSPTPAATAAPIEQTIIPVSVEDGSRFELLCVHPAGTWHQLLYWLPAMGIPARHYLPLAEALAARGIAVVVHEWRGIGSSNRRAGHHDDWGYRELLTQDLPAARAVVHVRWPQAACWLGGHSLGGQLGSMYASLHPFGQADPVPAGLVLVASGAPYWRRFRWGVLIGMAYVLAPWLARLFGYLPGRQIGFGGNEAPGVIADWARTGRTGRYAAAGMTQDFEQGLAALSLPILALRLHDDWLGPKASLDWLLGKMPRASRSVEVITAQDLGSKAADHFGWMKTPQAVATRIASWLAAQDATSAGHDGTAG
ncbi:alpha/beta hydrolase family protein [Rhodanobacter koreensis]